MLRVPLRICDRQSRAFTKSVANQDERQLPTLLAGVAATISTASVRTSSSTAKVWTGWSSPRSSSKG